MSETANLIPAKADPSAPAAALGAELRARRQTLGWQLPDLASSLRIRQSYLEAIEAGRIGDLPGTTYALGFVRAYASAMGLQGEEVASRFRAESAGATTRPALSFPAPVPQRGVPAGALMLLGLVIMAAAYSGWYYVSEHQRTPPETVPPIPDHLLPHAAEKLTPSPQVASILPTASAPTQPPPSSIPPPPTPSSALPALPAPASPGPASPASGAAANGPAPAPATTPSVQASMPQAGPAIAPSAPVVQPAAAPATPQGTRIVIKATAPAWVTVKPKGGGPTAFNKLMKPGDTWTVPANPPSVLLLTTGNAGATQLTVDNAPVVSLGPAGTVFRDLPLDADMLKSGRLPPSRPPKPRPVVAPEPTDDTALSVPPVSPPPHQIVPAATPPTPRPAPPTVPH